MLPIRYLYIRLQEKITENINAIEQAIVSLKSDALLYQYVKKSISSMPKHLTLLYLNQ